MPSKWTGTRGETHPRYAFATWPQNPALIVLQLVELTWSVYDLARISSLTSTIVLRSENHRLLRPEKAWRPIITVDVGGHHVHELTLGTDGQNPNLRQPFVLSVI